VEIETDLQLPAVLLSELQTAEARKQFGRCPIELVNSSSQERDVKLVRTGCACYDATLDGNPLKEGDLISIPAGKTRQILLEFQPADGHSEKVYTADFSSSTPDGTHHPAAVKCRMRIIADLRLTPSVIAADVLHNEGGTRKETLQIEHTSRGKSPSPAKPELSQLPEHLRVISINPEESAVQIEESLWRQVWNVELEVNLNQERPSDQVPQNFLVSMKDSEAKTVAQGQGSLLIHVRKSVAFPNRVHFGKLTVGSSRSRRILLTSTEDYAFRLKCNESLLPPEVKVRLNETMDERHLVELVFTPTTPGPFSETIKFETDMYDVGEISVRLEGLVE